MYEALFEMHQKAFGPLYKGDQLCMDNAGILVGLVQQQQAPPFVQRSTVNDLSGADSADDDAQSLAAVDEDDTGDNGGDEGPSSRYVWLSSMSAVRR